MSQPLILHINTTEKLLTNWRKKLTRKIYVFHVK